MDTAETAGIVIVTVAIIQGLIGLVKYLFNRQKDSKEEEQSSQLQTIFNLLTKTDGEGMPLVYFPRTSYGETQRIIVEKLQTVSEVQLKMLGIIERLERRIEILDKPGGL